MALRGSAVAAILVALFIGGETKQPDSCSAETGNEIESGNKLIQLKAKEAKKKVGRHGSPPTEDINSKEPDDCKPMFCLMYGDPHTRTFDGAEVILQQGGYFWISKSDAIQIQGYAERRGLTQKVVVTGPFLRAADGKDHTLEASMGQGKTLVSWDGAEILQTEDVFSVPGLVNFRVLASTLASEEHKKELPEWKQSAMQQMMSWQQGTKGGHVHLELPWKVELFVSTTPWSGGQTMEVIAKIPKNLGPFEGLCGNMNGNPDDDTKPMVSPTIMLQTGSSGCPEGCENCEAAMTACGNFKQAFFRNSCIYDVCQGVDPAAAAEGALDAEIMEVEEARNIPTFMGHGICLDSTGNKYTNFENSDLITEDDCKKALASNLPGLWGAQMQKGGACQLIVDPRHASLHSFAKVSDGLGSGMVSSIEEKEGYSCWRVV